MCTDGQDLHCFGSVFFSCSKCYEEGPQCDTDCGGVNRGPLWVGVSKQFLDDQKPEVGVMERGHSLRK